MLYPTSGQHEISRPCSATKCTNDLRVFFGNKDAAPSRLRELNDLFDDLFLSDGVSWWNDCGIDITSVRNNNPPFMVASPLRGASQGVLLKRTSLGNPMGGGEFPTLGEIPPNICFLKFCEVKKQKIVFRSDQTKSLML